MLPTPQPSTSGAFARFTYTASYTSHRCSTDQPWEELQRRVCWRPTRPTAHALPTPTLPRTSGRPHIQPVPPTPTSTCWHQHRPRPATASQGYKWDTGAHTPSALPRVPLGVSVTMNQGYSPENFLVFDDNALLVLYCQAVAAVGLAAPLYLLLLQEALGGVEQTLVYGMRATSAASAFLLLVHFVTANMNLRLVLLPRERKPQAPMHAQHALSLLFTTHQARGVFLGGWAGVGFPNRNGSGISRPQVPLGVPEGVLCVVVGRAHPCVSVRALGVCNPVACHVHLVPVCCAHV